jgi:phosphate transport system permease protein
MTRVASWFFSLVALGALLLLVGTFAWQSGPVWQHAGTGYVTGTKWFFRAKQFGALPMIYGSLAVSAIAVVLAAPVGLGASIFIAEYLPRRTRLMVKMLIELLAGIPSVIYGLIGILILREWVYTTFEKFELLSGDTLLTAGILLAVMILPTIVTLADDALRSVPGAQRRAARALGLNHAETVLAVSLPQARRGMVSAVLLSLGRAMGETIAVFLVVGRQDNNLPANWLSPRALLESGQTLTSKLGGAESTIAYKDPLHWGAIVGLALILLVITGTITWAGTSFGRRRHE